MKNCYIIGAGECLKLDFVKSEGDLVIAADGGMKYLEENGVIPDIIIGDFDSLGFIPDGVRVIRLKPEKDFTDMHAAVKIGLDSGFEAFHLYGACGGRIDHTFANVQLLVSLVQRGKKAYIYDGYRVITAVYNSALDFDSEFCGYVSVFSHSDRSIGVTLKGLKYELENAELVNNFALGVSNEFIGTDSEISVRDGTLVVVYSHK